MKSTEENVQVIKCVENNVPCILELDKEMEAKNQPLDAINAFCASTSFATDVQLSVQQNSEVREKDEFPFCEVSGSTRKSSDDEFDDQHTDDILESSSESSESLVSNNAIVEFDFYNDGLDSDDDAEKEVMIL